MLCRSCRCAVFSTCRSALLREHLPRPLASGCRSFWFRGTHPPNERLPLGIFFCRNPRCCGTWCPLLVVYTANTLIWRHPLADTLRPWQHTHHGALIAAHTCPVDSGCPSRFKASLVHIFGSAGLFFTHAPPALVWALPCPTLPVDSPFALVRPLLPVQLVPRLLSSCSQLALRTVLS